ncbi:MAG: multifunctional CCA addition/repair protein [Gammaproteobacteria bacterium]|nr:multifunctional CCA addition/repair protein [Gammaproteobacteria bacterium]MDH5729838.1 multifunctional CCA addition/repair protein [Gammaproteobacteria bacterium]
MEIYLVGGAVRDELLGLSVQERDWLVVGASPEQMLELGYKPVGKDFPVFIHAKTGDEYALARTERKSGHGYTGFEFNTDLSVTLEQDLSRRDLTINAIAKKDEQLFDPYGGVKDLENRILRHVSHAFVEDPLRVLRVARFAARFSTLGFKIASETRALMAAVVDSGELEHLTPERIWMEIQKALTAQTPSVFFIELRQINALNVIVPEIDALFGVPQTAIHHPEIDTGLHTMMVVDAASKLTEDIEARFAALLHDLGKADTPESEWPRHIKHEQASVIRVRQLCQRLRIPNRLKDTAMLVARYHTHCHKAFELRPDTLLNLLEKLDVFRQKSRLESFLLACEADARGRTGFENCDYPQADFLRRLAEACKQVSSVPLQQQGLEGKAIGAALKRERLQTISRIKHELLAS